MECFGPIHILLMLLTASLLVGRYSARSKAARHALTILPALTVSCVFLGFAAPYFPGQLSFFLPYEHVGRWETTEVAGKPTFVDVYFKNVSPSPHEPRQRFKIVGPSSDGTATIIYDTEWRFWSGRVKSMPGGVEICYGSHPTLRFRMKDDRWVVTELPPPSE